MPKPASDCTSSPEMTSAGVFEIQAPVKITDLHVQDRETSTVAGSPRAWRKMTEIENAYQRERMGAKDSKEARVRLASALMFESLWNCSQSAGRDSTAGFHVDRSMGSGSDLNASQRGAIERLVRIEMRLGRNDRTIVRGLCAYGHTPAEAVALAGLPEDTRVTPRFCEALDALTDALERTSKGKKHGLD